MKAIIMAGGQGSRLRPLTCDRPKPMVPIMNRPMMEHIVSLLKSYDLKEIGVTLQYLPEQIENYFGDGREFGVNMRYFIEDSPLGTAGSVKNSGSFLDETFIVISGDALTDFDLQKAIEFHRAKGGVATLVLTSVETPLEYGVVIANEEGRITQFLEKPSWGEVFSDTVNTGIYILEPEVLQYVPEGAQFDFAKDLFPLLMQKGYPLYGYVAEGYWCDIGNIEQYHGAHLDILKGTVKVNIQEREQSPGVYVGENVIIEPGAQINAPALIGSGSRIGRGACVDSYTVLGPNTQVEAYASVKRGLIWRNGYIGQRAQIRGAMLCNRVQVMRHSALYEGSVVGDDTTIEENSIIKPNVKIWPHKLVESGSVVSESLIWGAKPAKSLFGFDGISGIVNVEITPELVAKLSVAYGSLLGEGSQVVVSSDDWKASRMLKEAAVSGLLSAGIRVYDLGETVTPITRRAVKELDVKGGIHLQLSREDNTNTKIKFFDSEGLNLAKGWERKIEQAYYREDFKRIKGLEVGETVKLTSFTEKYLQQLLDVLDLQVLKNTQRKVVLAYPTPWLYSLLVPFLQQLNCEVFTISLPAGEPLTMSVLQNHFNEVAEAVTGNGADLGVVMDANAENLVLFDSQGRYVDEDMFMALSSLIIFKANAGGTMAVPITAPGVIEQLAKEHQGRVLRTKTEPRSLMEALSDSKAENMKYDPFTLSFDAIASLGRILEFMASEDVSLATLLDSIPPFFLHKQDVDCSWGVKGAVMRRLIEETQNDDVELVDGVKVRHPQGWALVLPDSERPVYRVYGEGYSTETAEELTDMYAEKIKKIQQELGK
ncbi:sugar phosphate nucleotidyltransferase [Dethiobacter alkaliphilus]|uniref:sugar phosphate nucleotidyltransferase n=1 Tax=Dethiobacter alkaliphilus TaxID=427926 RepID=UPI002226A2B0|nr:sugar phosphate nucleotidyltransferase [Dethiobacter alkaliphilus]MCW3489303.1 sugar phosphate nucleotidyltransferase [Dethiobacter alkaliphilus]